MVLDRVSARLGIQARRSRTHATTCPAGCGQDSARASVHMPMRPRQYKQARWLEPDLIVGPQGEGGRVAAAVHHHVVRIESAHRVCRGGGKVQTIISSTK